MDINDVRTLITVVSFSVFVGIVVWAWSGRQRDSFKEAANIPFADSDLPPQAGVNEELPRQSAARGRP
jgi:cytochrome c oxidase cbb3-type subunit 4